MKLKKDLYEIIDKISISIDNSSKELNKRDLLSNIDYNKLTHLVQAKERELQNHKISLNIYKKQFENVDNKSNDKKALEK